MENWLLTLQDIYDAQDVKGIRSLFIHAPEKAGSMEAFKGISHFQCYLAEDASALMNAGADVDTEIPEGEFDDVLVRACQNRNEMKGLIALAASCVKPTGRIFIAQSNDMGAKALDKDLRTAFLGMDVTIKHKCRGYVLEIAAGCDVDVLKEWALQGALQHVNDTGFAAQPGLFGWQKIDKGSAFLIDVLAQEEHALKGIGADFGCGYGYLTHQILQQPHHNISRISLLDHDIRALMAAETNLSALGMDAERIELLWRDVSAPVNAPQKLDFVIMNPPFHEGKKGVPTLGMQFIKNAADNLKKGGRLIMVANTHLPYEHILREEFTSVEELSINSAFKVIEGRK